MRKRLVSCALAALLLAAPAAAAQDFIDWQQITSRAAGTVIPVYDPAADDYRWITFEDLLAGLVAFDDQLTRYVALSGSETAPTFTEADFLAGTSGTGFLSCLAFPTPPAMATAAYIGIAVPATWDLSWIGLGFTVSGLNSINVFEELTTTLTISGESYTVWRSFARQSTAFINENSYACLHRQATIPSP